MFPRSTLDGCNPRSRPRSALLCEFSSGIRPAPMLASIATGMISKGVLDSSAKQKVIHDSWNFIVCIRVISVKVVPDESHVSPMVGQDFGTRKLKVTRPMKSPGNRQIQTNCLPPKPLPPPPDRMMQVSQRLLTLRCEHTQGQTSFSMNICVWQGREV